MDLKSQCLNFKQYILFYHSKSSKFLWNISLEKCDFALFLVFCYIMQRHFQVNKESCMDLINFKSIGESSVD